MWTTSYETNNMRTSAVWAPAACVALCAVLPLASYGTLTGVGDVNRFRSLGDERISSVSEAPDMLVLLCEMDHAPQSIPKSLFEAVIGRLKTQRFYCVGQFSIQCRRIEEQGGLVVWLVQPQVTLMDEQAEPTISVVAEKAMLEFIPTKNMLRIVLHHCEVEGGYGPLRESG